MTDPVPLLNEATIDELSSELMKRGRTVCVMVARDTSVDEDGVAGGEGYTATYTQWEGSMAEAMGLCQWLLDKLRHLRFSSQDDDNDD